MKLSHIFGQTSSKQDAYIDLIVEWEGEREFLDGIAEAVTERVKQDPVMAASWLELQHLDMEEMLALFFLLHSSTRSALKRGQHELKHGRQSNLQRAD